MPAGSQHGHDGSRVRVAANPYRSARCCAPLVITESDWLVTMVTSARLSKPSHKVGAILVVGQGRKSSGAEVHTGSHPEICPVYVPVGAILREQLGVVGFVSAQPSAARARFRHRPDVPRQSRRRSRTGQIELIPDPGSLHPRIGVCAGQPNQEGSCLAADQGVESRGPSLSERCGRGVER